MIYFLTVLSVLNLILLLLVGMNIIQLREIIQSFMEGPPIDYPPEDDGGLDDIETSQISYSTEPLIEE